MYDQRTYTTATGEFRIEPPLTYAEFKDSPYRPEVPNEPDVLFDVETTEVDGPDGVMLLHRAVAVLPCSDRPFAYHVGLIKTMQKLLDEYGDAHTFTGYFECRDSNDHTPGDPWRIVVRDGQAVRIDPTITWPEA